MPQVKTIQFVSKNQALAQERKKHPAMVNSLPYNPFPNAFKVYPKQAEQIDTIATQLGNANLKGIESVCPPAPGSKAASSAAGGELQPHLAPRALRCALPVDRRADRLHRPAHLLDPARREHDPALDLRAAHGRSR